jgi:hypothetical protein
MAVSVVAPDYQWLRQGALTDCEKTPPPNVSANLEVQLRVHLEGFVIRE